MLCFTYFRAMPELVDFLFSFGYQSRAQDPYFSSFRQRTCISPSNQAFNVPELAWSGYEISACYNLRSPERSGSGPSGWSMRVCAVHHTLDLREIRANWIIIKGNGVIKDRIEQIFGGPANGGISSLETIDTAFAASLKVHMVLCDWAVEQWRWYINSLDEKFQETSRKTLTAPIIFSSSPVAKDEFEPPVRAETGLSNGSILGRLSRTPTMLTEKFSHANPKAKPSAERRYTDPESGLSQPLPPHLMASNDVAAAQSPRQVPESSEDREFSFSKLQKIQHIEEKAHEALLVIRLNCGIIRQLKQYYDTIFTMGRFPQQVAQLCKDDMEQFALRVNGILDELQMQVVRLETLIQLLKDRKTLVISIIRYLQVVRLRHVQLHSILEYHNTQYNKLSTKT